MTLLALLLAIAPLALLAWADTRRAPPLPPRLAGRHGDVR